MTTINDIYGNEKITSELETVKEVCEQEKADLWNANLWNANLWNANLRNADLWGANLRNANLWNANLRNANLRDADLRNANLRNANLRDADLRNADLSDANFRHVDSRYLWLNEDKEILFRMDCCVWPVTIFRGKVMIGCKDFSFAEILEMTEEAAECIHEGAGKRWKRFGRTLKMAIQDIIDSGI